MELCNRLSFELRIAAQRDPREATAAAGDSRVAASRAPATLVVLRGELTEAGLADALRAIAQAFESGSGSVVVELERVTLNDRTCLGGFAAALMAQRAAGRHVQVVARQPAVHALCETFAGARDWLIADSTADPSGGRQALHVDRSAAER